MFESIPNKKKKKKQCVNCGLAEFDRKGSGRRDLNSGSCKAAVTLPHSFIDRFSRVLPSKTYISKYTKEGCPLWEKM